LPQFDWIAEITHRLDQSFKLSNQPKGIISFETNEFLKGVEFISPLFNAILYNQTLKISYQSFNSYMPQIIIFHPYHLKQYNNRWFLFGKNKDYENLTNLALDRINSIENSKEAYIPNTSFDFDEYFEDFIGVTKSGDVPIKIILFAKQKVVPYIKTKPLHGSQKKIKDCKDGFTFSIEVIPNFELEKLILSFGEDLIVNSPDDFKTKILNRIQTSYYNYK
jgi:predicted DNA-binding transcriptional regulator YafY